MIRGGAPHTAISPRETVVLFPTCAHYVARRGVWRVPIGGAIFEPGVVNLRRRLLLRILRRVMQVPPEAFHSDIFRQRISAFIADTERGKRVAIRAGTMSYQLDKRTRRDGQFWSVLELKDEEARRLETHGSIHDGWFDYSVRLPQGDDRTFGGRARLLPAEGLSVISDIDDTIKHTGVWSRRALLTNTFLREFEHVAGMAECFGQWASRGAAFHYVSSSPWQLYEPLAGFLRCAGFPEGTFHLRSFRLRDHMLRRVLLLRRHGKLATIRRLVRAYPGRRFILVGDSGERDPEIYGDVARRFPRQIERILIRVVPGRAWTEQRAARAFRRLPASVWTCFEEAAQVPIGDW